MFTRTSWTEGTRTELTVATAAGTNENVANHANFVCGVEFQAVTALIDVNVSGMSIAYLSVAQRTPS